jgi:hypothetical protein
MTDETTNNTPDLTAKIIQTTTRLSSNNAWSWSHDGKLNNIYSEEEYTQYIEPFFAFIESTLGFKSLEFFVDDNTRTYTITYETVPTAAHAYSQLYGPNAHPIVKAYREATTIKRESLNIEYGSNTTTDPIWHTRTE